MRRRPSLDSNRHARSGRRRFAPEAQALEARRLLTVGVPPLVVDFGFETSLVGSGAAAYAAHPSGTPWTYTGYSGVTADETHFTSGNPGAPQGDQAAFLMGDATIDQQVTGWEAGAYAITFKAAQRANYPGVQTIQVKVDGQVVGTFQPSETSYEKFTTAAFVVTEGAHTLTFAGPDANSATVFLDEVSIVAAVPVVGDSGFEDAVTAAGAFGRPSSGSAWNFSEYGAGVSANGSLFTFWNADAPQAGQVAYLQSDVAAVSQTLQGWKAGAYTLVFKAAQRYGANAQTIQVKLDGEVVAAVMPTQSVFETYRVPLTVSAGAHTLTFAGATSGDHTAFIDDVLIYDAASPPPIGDPSFEVPSVGTGYIYGPSGSAWTFLSSAGISADGTAFTSGNPNAPSGGQVAFLQSTGVMAQTISDWQAGAYTLSFKAAKRGNGDGDQSIQVSVDGKVVEIVKPSGSAYQTFHVGFTVASGTHTVTLAGLATSDAAAFIDAVSITSGAPVLGDSGFEALTLSPENKILANPQGSVWTFSNSGITTNDSDYTVGISKAPQGGRAAFLPGRGMIEQVVQGWQAGTYAISFKAAQRTSNNQTIQLRVDGIQLGAFTPSGGDYQTFVTAPFEVIAGRHLVNFTGLDETQLQTAFIDDVRIIPIAARPGAPGGESIVLNATIRDFTSSHPDVDDPRSYDPHVVKGLVADELGPDGLPVFIGANGAGNITSASTFNQWFRSTPGVNSETVLPLTFTEIVPGAGVYEFADDLFFPIDGRLLGDEGGLFKDGLDIPHNYFFTLQLRASFTYRGGETFMFSADDDLWVFIDGRLVLDMGGLNPAANGIVSLDGLGLSKDQPHTLDVFYAERHAPNAVLRMQTSGGSSGS